MADNQNIPYGLSMQKGQAEAANQGSGFWGAGGGFESIASLASGILGGFGEYEQSEEEREYQESMEKQLEKGMSEQQRLAGKMEGISDQYASPLLAQITSQAQQMGTPEDIARAGGEAMIRYQQELEKQKEQRRRNLMRMGVSPESGMFDEGTGASEALGLVSSYGQGAQGREQMGMAARQQALGSTGSAISMLSQPANLWDRTASTASSELQSVRNLQAAKSGGGGGIGSLLGSVSGGSGGGVGSTIGTAIGSVGGPIGGVVGGVIGSIFD